MPLFVYIQKVVRGGSWFHGRIDARASNTDWRAHKRHNEFVGLRCARNMK